MSGIQWPMNVLTRPAGENRKLQVHPKELVSRSAIRRDVNGKFKSIPLSEIKLMKEIGTDPRSRLTLYVEVKQQGHRHFYCRDFGGRYHMYGRRLNVGGEYPDLISKIENDMTLPDIPRETVIDCELIWPGHPDSEVPTAIKECPEELRMVAFGAPIVLGETYLNEDSLSYKKGRVGLIELIGQEFIIKKGFPIIFTPENASENIIRLLEEADIACIEGWVLKQESYYGWWKLKGISEADVFVTGFKISESETRYGMVTAVVIGVYNEKTKSIINVGSVSGFDEDAMHCMTRAYKKYETADNPYYLKVLRVQYQELTNKGNLKHAFFDGWRDDKDWKDCTPFTAEEND